MKKTNFLTKMPVVEEEFFINRIQYCKIMLYLHGFLTQGECDKVKERINKEMKRQGIVVKKSTPEELLNNITILE